MEQQNKIPIKISLVDDYIELMFKETENLKSHGFIFEEYPDWIAKRIQIYSGKTPNELYKRFKQDRLYSYANLLEKIPSLQPRSIKYSADFHCPDEYRTGLSQLENKIKTGQSLFPHLSRKIFTADEQDGMLFDFGVFHLHLGIKADTNHPSLIEGTDQVLYVMFDNTTAYFLVVDHHGRWVDTELMRIAKRNFPEVLESRKVKGIVELNEKISDGDRSKLRKARINAFIEIDGDVYASHNMGINSAGGSVHAVIKINRTLRRLRDIQHLVQDIIETHQEEIRRTFSVARFTLKLHNLSPLTIIDDASNVIITICPENFMMDISLLRFENNENHIINFFLQN